MTRIPQPGIADGPEQPPSLNGASSMSSADVIVVGAGPVGLMLAGELRLAGLSVIVYERKQIPDCESRALGFNRRTLESLDQRGLLPLLGGFRIGPIGHFGGVRFDLDLLDENHAGVLGLSQARTEDALRAWVDDLGVSVRMGHEVTGIEQRPHDVTAHVHGPGGQDSTTARFLVGCDGAGSAVRTLAAISTRHWPATRGMYTAELSSVALKVRPAGERLPGGRMVVCTPVGEGRVRIVIHDPRLPVDPDLGALTFSEVAVAWEELTGESIANAEHDWVWASGNSATLADAYRQGRVFLAGDAAHEIPPLAAWGVSAGVQDAVNLAWKLAAAVQGWAPEGLLGSYHSERHPIGVQLVRNAQAAQQLYLGDDTIEPVRTIIGEALAGKDAAKHIAGIVSGLGVRYDVGPGDHPLLGRRLDPDLELTLPNGTTARIAELLHTARGLLITTNTAPEVARAYAHRVDTVTGTWTTPRTTPLDAALVRPDGYIAWTSHGTQKNLEDALEQWFGPSLDPQPNAAPPLSPPPMNRSGATR
jgi:2-polyprenyl-6-methoxyphenol hydroxylase-like FAD-dependent oxidoreductase